MYDQLRFDYLSCAGHPHLKTPNFDKIAQRGVRFTNTYVQSPICGASRMSFYTGRYTSSHGAEWNGYPLRVGEQTLGDHLRKLGMQCWLVGKTHMKADAEGMERLGLTPDTIIGARQAECGFDVWIRDDGLWGEGPDGFYDQKRSPYNEYLKSEGYDAHNPWADFANSGIDNGEKATGWFFNNADKPANIKERDSETPWLTNQAIDFMKNQTGPWLAHISYIKPHWPYIVPAPYNSKFNSNHILPPRRHKTERKTKNPLYQSYQNSRVAKAFQNENVRQKVIPAYMGLIKQCDDQLGRIIEYLENSKEIDNTMIVLTSDHGDYLGDHWLGEKDLFHEQSVKVPLIVYDPRPEANITRGTTCDALTESLDLVATFIDFAGGQVPNHIVEGKSIIPWLNGDTPEDWRKFVVSEYNFSATQHRQNLNLNSSEARLYMIFDGRHKLIHCQGDIPPMLFDLQKDPDEYFDLGQSNQYKPIRDKLYGYLYKWSLRNSQRVTKSDDDIEKMLGASLRRGILPFLIDGTEVPSELVAKYVGPISKNYSEEN